MSDSTQSRAREGETIVDVVACEMHGETIPVVRRPATEETNGISRAELAAAEDLDSYRPKLPLETARDDEIVGQILVDEDGETELLEP